MHVRIAAALNRCYRPRLPTRTIPGLNRIDNNLCRPELSLQEGRFVALYFVGIQLLMPPGYRDGLKQ